MARHGVITLDDRMDYQVWMTFTGQHTRILAMTRQGTRLTVAFGLPVGPRRPSPSRGNMYALQSG